MADTTSGPTQMARSNSLSSESLSYLNKFLRFAAAPELLKTGLYKDAQEITACMALYNAYYEHIFPLRTKPLLVVVEGSSLPRFAMLLSKVTGLEVLSICPFVSDFAKKEYETACSTLRIYTGKVSEMLLTEDNREIVIINNSLIRLSEIASRIVTESPVHIIALTTVSDDTNICDLHNANKSIVLADIEYTDARCWAHRNCISVFMEVNDLAVEFSPVPVTQPSDDDEDVYEDSNDVAMVELMMGFAGATTPVASQTDYFGFSEAERNNAPIQAAIVPEEVFQTTPTPAQSDSAIPPSDAVTAVEVSKNPYEDPVSGVDLDDYDVLAGRYCGDI